MKLSDMIRDPVVTSRFGEMRSFSKHPHSGVDVVSKSGERFLRVPANGHCIWQWNMTSRSRSAAVRIFDDGGAEYPMGWMYSDIFGMICTWFADDSDMAISFCHLEPFQSADIAQRAGVMLWETRERHQEDYQTWHDWYGNVEAPQAVAKGQLIGVYTDNGSSRGAHTHIELRHMTLGKDTAAKWHPIDLLSVVEEA